MHWSWFKCEVDEFEQKHCKTKFEKVFIKINKQNIFRNSTSFMFFENFKIFLKKILTWFEYTFRICKHDEIMTEMA